MAQKYNLLYNLSFNLVTTKWQKSQTDFTNPVRKTQEPLEPPGH